MSLDDIKAAANKAWEGITSALQQSPAQLDAMNNAVYDVVNYKDTMLSSPRVLAEHLLHKQCTTGTLTIPVRNYDVQGASGKTVTIPFFLAGDFTLSFGNTWQDALPLDSLGKLADFVNGVHMVTGNTSQIAIQSEAMSAQVWKGSTFGGFNLDCLFVCTNRRFNTLKIINNIAATCLPIKYSQQPDVAGPSLDAAKATVNGLIGIGGAVLGTITDNLGMEKAKGAINEFSKKAENYVNDMGMIAPLNYGLSPGDNTTPETPLPNSTVTLQIGNYFRASELLVESLGGVTFSKEIVGPPTNNFRRDNDLYSSSAQGTDWGFPLYVKCQIKLKPHSMMHFTKWQNYFLRPQDRHDYPTASIKTQTVSE